MLCIYKLDLEGEPVLKIEEEPHFWYTHRIRQTQTELPDLNPSDDYETVWNIGHRLLLSIIHAYECQTEITLSIHDYDGYPLIRQDVRCDPNDYPGRIGERKFITQIPLPSLKSEDTVFNDRLCHAVGQTVLKLLLDREPGKQ